MLGELGQIEDVMLKLARVTASPDILPEINDQLIEDGKGGGLATPSPTPPPSDMGSRKSSMTSIASRSMAMSPESSTGEVLGLDVLEGVTVGSSCSGSVNGSIYNYSLTSPRPGSAASSKQVLLANLGTLERGGCLFSFDRNLRKNTAPHRCRSGFVFVFRR